MADYATHHASVVVNAPVHQVYSLFTHFNDFPKFMSFIKEVTYYDNQRSHWVADVVGHHEWDATNDNWIPDQQVGWRSTNGLENFGKVTFQPTSANQTQVDVYVNYNPPAGVLGDVGENLGAGKRFDNALQNDLNNFAKMVDQAPAGALDPNSSNYLFHSGSAAAQGNTTSRQNESMQNDPNLQSRGMQNDPTYTGRDQGMQNDPTYTGTDRPTMDRDITGTTNQELGRQRPDAPTTGGVPADDMPLNPPMGNRDMPGY